MCVGAQASGSVDVRVWVWASGCAEFAVGVRCWCAGVGVLVYGGVRCAGVCVSVGVF